MDRFVTCSRTQGGTIRVPQTIVQDRPSAYGLMRRDDGRYLMIESSSHHRLWFPGGGIDQGESAEEALRREVREEAGLEIKNLGRWTFFENFVYSDHDRVAYHVFQLFFHCQVVGDPDQLVAQDPTEGLPAWVDFATLPPDCLQDIAPRIIAEYLTFQRRLV